MDILINSSDSPAHHDDCGDDVDDLCDVHDDDFDADGGRGGDDGDVGGERHGACEGVVGPSGGGGGRVGRQLNWKQFGGGRRVRCWYRLRPDFPDAGSGPSGEGGGRPFPEFGFDDPPHHGNWGDHQLLLDWLVRNLGCPARNRRFQM
jgi:hypothetical protein